MTINVVMRKLGTPARKAIQNAKIETLEDLAGWTEKDFAALNGIGHNAMNSCREVLLAHGLTFKK